VLAELALIEVMLAVKRLASSDARARSVRFAHAPFAGSDALREIFGCTPAFHAAANAVVLPTALADAPLAVSRDLLRKALEHDAVQAEERLPARTSTIDRVRAMAHGFPSLREVARRLRVSARTLQRQLAAEGTSYFEVLDALRREAVVALTAQGLSEKAIAFEVGFGDSRALHRARRRWGPRHGED
jgi:AraC-like DNA-binding protein